MSTVRAKPPLEVTLVTVYLVLMLLIPSRLVIAPLGGAGSPQQLFCFVLLGLWVATSIARQRRSLSSQPLNIAVGFFATSFLISYIVAALRPIDSIEASSANLGLLAASGWVGLALFCSNNLGDWDSLLVIARRISLIGGLLAVLAITQFLTGQLLIDRIWFPGLSVNGTQTLSALTERGGFNRPAATFVHPIEFGAVITMILPISLTLALQDRGRGFAARWFPPVAIAFAVMMSISRSALLSGGVALLLFALALSPSVRRRGLALAVVFLAFVAIVIPGMLGTLLGLFTSIGNDSSAESRTNAYPIAQAFISRSPLFGRGFGTFLPQIHILDNSMLGLVIEVGFVGLAAFLCLVLTAWMASQRARRGAPDEITRLLSHAFGCALAAGVIGLAFYDGFGFPSGAAMIFFVVGLCGCARRLAVWGPTPENDSSPDGVAPAGVRP